ncbi:ParA family protein [Virgibacillus dokdonensis]|uniref:Chromosome partitioning protein ParA n=1 Tax=Virgibacillus dokdonensis TaxID=302167 RepID=A0A2K9J2B7_9BACI|nr:AAA family ATPase [Virgibacillus dokdonensis]AUJ25173.1 Chromosome partitioning protein ParA [Virgibacillus dokdonensis]
MDRHGKIISFINMKGGVGKTTLCKEMANYISLTVNEATNEKFKVLVIDIDPQSNLTQAFDSRFPQTNMVISDESGNVIQGKRSIEKIFNNKPIENTKDIIVELHDNLDIIPGELETVFLERAQNNNTAHKLMDFVKDNKITKDYDFIFIDCPPTYSVYTEMAFFISDFYFVPVIPDAYSTLGVDLLERVVDDIVYNNRNTIFSENKPLNLGVVFTRVDKANKPQQESYIKALGKSDIVNEKKIYIFKSMFTESNKLSTSEFEKLITDREDKRLGSMLSNLCTEFLYRVEDLTNG